MDKDIDAHLAPEICSIVIKHLARGERLLRVSHDGDFTTIIRGNTEVKWLPGRLQSTIFLETMRMYYAELDKIAKNRPQASIYAPPEETDFILNLWPTARDGFCKYHPGEAYLELSNIESNCPEKPPSSILGKLSYRGVTWRPDSNYDRPSIASCHPPLTLRESEKNGWTPYDCRLFSYPNF